MLSFRKDIHAAVEQARFDDLERLIVDDRGAVRHLLGLTYAADPEVSRTAARGLAIAARHHPGLVQNTLRRLIWAMNDESATNAVTAPRVFEAIAAEQPELLLPMIPDLLRLRDDESLREGILNALSAVADACPGSMPPAIEAQFRKPGGNGEPR